MNEQFIKSIYKEMVEGNCALYKDLYQNTNIDECTIEYWKKALELYNSLNNTQKETFFQIIRQIIIDTISNIFGILDGSSALPDEDFEFDICINGESSENELQDIFLDIIEQKQD